MTFESASNLRLLVLLAAAAAFAGCNRAPYDMAPVKGTVLLDGQPISVGTVMFAPKAAGGSLKAGKSAIGKIDEGGEFVLSTYGRRDGAVVAEHAVTIINTAPDSPDGQRLNARRVMIPGRLVVAAGQQNEFTIELTSEIVAKYGMRK